MNNLQLFRSEQFGQIRVIEHAGETWFVAPDIIRVLDLSNVTSAVMALEEDERSKFNLGRQGDGWAVSEPGLYSLILRSRKPEAKAFKRWVTHEVLPTIRKTGGYQIPETLSGALQLAADQARQLEEQKPAVEFYEAVTDSKTAISMAQVAKVLDLGIGRNKLFALLREQGILRQNNEPYQDYIDRGWFRVIEQKFQTPEGETKISIKTLVYQRGVQHIARVIRQALEGDDE